MTKKSNFSKYGNKKVALGGIVFDSIKECEHYEHLCLRQAAGEITDLQRQVKFELKPAYYEDVVVQLKTKTKIVKKLVQYGIYYIADFTYKENGNLIVCDCKASKTFQDEVYRLKKKLMYSELGIKIKEIY